MNKVVYPFLFVLFLFSCSSGDSCEEGDPSCEQVVFDSLAYYDSVYAPFRFTIDTFFRNRCDRKEFNGNVLVAIRGHIVIQQSYGATSPGGNDSLNLNHRFQLASGSKPFTAAAILLVRDQGKLSLDDTISKYLDSLPYPGITIRMLLNHRGGLSNYNYFADDYWTDKSKPICNDGVLKILREQQPKAYYPPNTKFDYSNTGYALLASIVESVSGKAFGDFMTESVFSPLGMKNSVIYDKCKGDVIDSALNGYDWKGRLIEDHYQNGVTGDKGMYSTVGDLYLFSEAIRTGKLLSKQSWKEAFEPQHSEEELKGKDNYGLGWRLKNSFAGYTVVYHTGWWKGFRSWFIRNTTLDHTIIVLDNIKRNRFLSVEELLDLTDGGTFAQDSLMLNLE